MAGTDVGSAAPEARPLVGAFMTDEVMHVEHEDRRLAGLLRMGRPVLLDLANRLDLREVVGQWGRCVDVASTSIDDRPADAVLMRPDAVIVWAAAVGEPADTALFSLQAALAKWLGPP
jgi:hypothetical protein